MNFIVWLIIFCEVAFWVVILLGLVTRYIFKLKKLGLFFLALTPVIDLIDEEIATLTYKGGKT